MQIVIDIDDNLYTRLFDNGDEYVADMRRACVSIRKGTPLPKGHGKLIDENDFEKRIAILTHSMDLGYGEIMDVIDDTPPIIEADKESEG